MTSMLPAGFNFIPAGPFVAGALIGQQVAAFGMKATPVTNAEWGAFAKGLGEDRFVLLEHNWDTGETVLKRKARTIEKAVAGPVSIPEGINFDAGDVIVFGSAVLLKIADNPSAQYDAGGRVFSHPNQPVVGLSYFHHMVWCLIKSLEDGGLFRYDLPTDLQFEYVASDRGTKKYGTETGGLYGADGRKLAHIDEYRNGRGTTVAVDDSHYVQELPFGVQTTGNVWRRTKFNADFKSANVYFWGPYGLRGGSWLDDRDFGRASFRGRGHGARPGGRDGYVGFSPVVVRQDSR